MFLRVMGKRVKDSLLLFVCNYWNLHMANPMCQKAFDGLQAVDSLGANTRSHSLTRNDHGAIKNLRFKYYPHIV